MNLMNELTFDEYFNKLNENHKNMQPCIYSFQWNLRIM
jgi:hypothetical protein